MLTTEQINDLHRLYWSEHWPIRKIERHLRMGWRHDQEVSGSAGADARATAPASSKLDPFKATIAEWLEKDPAASAAVIEQRLRPLGYAGGHTILREYVHEVRPQLTAATRLRAHGTDAGERFEVDWGHFGSLDYARRPAQALCLRPGRCAQPHAVSGVHAQPEFRDLRPLSHSCVSRH